MKNKKEIDNACTRVFETLKYLNENNASITDIINYFSKNGEGKYYSNVAISKYINTLKVFGFEFKKTKDKYMISKIPFQTEFTREDVEAILIFKKALEIFPETIVPEKILKFSSQIKKHFNETAQKIYDEYELPQGIYFEHLYDELQNKIKEIEQYCIRHQRLKINYTNLNGDYKTILCDPQELQYIDNKAYLRVFNATQGNVIDIELENIIEITQLPTLTHNVNLQSKVLFRLKNKLAKRYELRENERVQNIEPNGDIVIVNENEDKDLLLRRLLRYDTECEIISPKYFRNEMISMINETLKLYE